MVKRLLGFVVAFWLSLALGIWAVRQGRRPAEPIGDEYDAWRFV